uniref:NAD-dependent epimerase/dehydratase domain-containing protein n=6 Tax=Aegilops tauschii TaxID=37682 RepID=A0A453HPH9_AEGTS
PEPIYKAMASTYHYRLPYPLPLTAAPPASASRCRFPMASTAPLGVTVSTSESVGQNDLLIVGPGVLGRIVAEKWRQEHPDCKIYGQTATTDHHSELTKIGIIPSLKGPRVDQKVPYVIFCAPPYRTDDYPGDLRINLNSKRNRWMGHALFAGTAHGHTNLTAFFGGVAASNWSGEGSFLFTSSTAVYDCNDNGFCGEDSPCVPIGMSPRTDVLLKAENVVLEAGGCALRLAGLYKKDQGPHVFWLSKGTVDARPDLIISMIHYEDAASLGIAIMKRRLRGRVFVGCDNQPLSRQEIMDRVNRSGKFDGKFEGFTGTDGPLGKRMDNSKTRAEIGWEPKYPSFTEFLGLSN